MRAERPMRVEPRLQQIERRILTKRQNDDRVLVHGVQLRNHVDKLSLSLGGWVSWVAGRLGSWELASWELTSVSSDPAEHAQPAR